MTASVALCELVPGDRILDLVAAGTVADITPLTRRDGRPADAMKVTLTDGTFIAGPSGWTVITMRETFDA